MKEGQLREMNRSQGAIPLVRASTACSLQIAQRHHRDLEKPILAAVDLRRVQCGPEVHRQSAPSHRSQIPQLRSHEAKWDRWTATSPNLTLWEWRGGLPAS